MGDNLLQDAFDLVGMTEAAFDICQFVERVRDLGVLRVQLAHFGESLTGTLQVTFGQIHFAQPVLGIARVLAVRVFAQESRERLAGLVEILGFDQVERSIVVELLFRRITGFGAGLRCLASSSASGRCSRCSAGIDAAVGSRIVGSRGSGCA